MLKTLTFIIGETLTVSGVASELLQFTKINETPEGPGWFSKGSEDGIVVFSTIYSSKFGGSNDEIESESTPESEKMDLPTAQPADDKKYQEFLDWQWQQFQQWKKNNEPAN